MQYDLPEVADPLLLTQAYPEELRFYGGDCTGRGMSVKKSVVQRSRK